MTLVRVTLVRARARASAPGLSARVKAAAAFTRPVYAGLQQGRAR
jgi:hypothetical protein